MKKTTVVFDLDGTLLDTLQDLANAVNYALEQQGMPKRTLEEVRQFVGNGVRLLMIRAVPDGENNPLFEETFALFKEYYGEHCNDNTKPYAGVVELIETLKEKGYAVAIVSNKIDFAVKELNDLYFKGIVPVAIGEKEGIRRKPAPDTVFEALKELGKTKEESTLVFNNMKSLYNARSKFLHEGKENIKDENEINAQNYARELIRKLINMSSGEKKKTLTEIRNDVTECGFGEF